MGDLEIGLHGVDSVSARAGLSFDLRLLVSLLGSLLLLLILGEQVLNVLLVAQLTCHFEVIVLHITLSLSLSQYLINNSNLNSDKKRDHS